MKKPAAPKNGKSPSELIDARIAGLGASNVRRAITAGKKNAPTTRKAR